MILQPKGKTGKTEHDFELRENAQWTGRKKALYAHIIVRNNKRKGDLEAKAEALWQILQSIREKGVQSLSRIQL